MGTSYSNIASQIDAFKELARLIFMSQMVPGIKDADMAFMILVECEITGQSIFEWDQENHIICGRPSMKYDAMIAAFNSMEGCRVKLLDKSPERAALLLIDGEDEREFSITWADAQKEPWVYEGKEGDNVKILAEGKTPPRMKAKYATPRSRAIMLYARLASDAIRSTRPEVTKGRYTPEEIEDFTVVDAHSVKTVVEPHKIESPQTPAKGDTTEPAAVEKPDPKPEPSAAEPVAKVAATADEPESKLESMNGKTSLSVDEPITTEQDAKIRELLKQLKLGGIADIVERVKTKLTASGLAGLDGLSIAEADALIRALESKEIEVWASSQVKGHSAVPT